MKINGTTKVPLEAPIQAAANRNNAKDSRIMQGSMTTTLMTPNCSTRYFEVNKSLTQFICLFRDIPVT